MANKNDLEALVDKLMNELANAEDEATLTDVFINYAPQLMPQLDDIVWIMEQRSIALCDSNPALARYADMICGALKQAKTKIVDVSKLPPFQFYELLTRKETTILQLTAKWQEHLGDGTWSPNWIMFIDTIIATRGQNPNPPSSLIDWAKVQVEAAKLVDEPSLQAQTLATLGALHLRIAKEIELGLTNLVEALECVSGQSIEIVSPYTRVVCRNVTIAFPHIEDHQKQTILLLGERIVRLIFTIWQRLTGSGTKSEAFAALGKVIPMMNRAGHLESIDLAEQALAWRNELVMNEETASAIKSLSDIVPDDIAFVILEDLRSLVAPLGNKALSASISASLGLILMKTYERNRALGKQDLNTERILELFDEAARGYEEISLLEARGGVLFLWSRVASLGKNEDDHAKEPELHARIEETARESVRLLESNPEDHYYPQACLHLGELLEEKRKLNEASDFFQKALDHAQRPELAEVFGVAVHKMAIMMAGQRDRQDTNRHMIPLLTKAYNSTIREDKKTWVECYQLLVHSRMFSYFADQSERSDNAWEIAKLCTQTPPDSSLSGAKRARFLHTQADGFKWLLHNNMVGTKKDLESLSEHVITLYENAANLYEGCGKTFGAIQSLASAAYMLIERENLEEAKTILDRAFAIDKGIMQGIILNIQGTLAERQGDIEQALEFYRLAAESDMIYFAPKPALNAKLYLANRAQILIHEHRYEEAYQDLLKAIDLHERDVKRSPELGANAIVTPFESSVVVLSQFWQPVYSDLSLVCWHLGKIKESFYYAEAFRANILERQAGFVSPVSSTNLKPYGLDSVSNVLASMPNCALVEFLARHDSTLAFVISGYGMDIISLPGLSDPVMNSLSKLAVRLDDKENSLTALYKDWISSDRHKDAEKRLDCALLEIGSLIFDEMFKPLLSSLDKAGIDTIIIAAHEGLERLPWNMMCWQEGNDRRFLIERFALCKVPSAAFIRPAVLDQHRKQSAIIITGDHPELDFLSIESTVVYERLRAILGEDVEKITVSDASSLSKAIATASHVHIASHGSFDDTDPLNSCLILGSNKKGNITIRSLLKGSKLCGCDIILSACETGAIMGHTTAEGVGLPMAFLLAGASSVMGAAWPVSDATSFLLMARFYRGVVTDGLAPVKALQQAQVWLRDQNVDGLTQEIKDSSAFWQDDLALRLKALALQRRIEQYPKETRPFGAPRHWCAFECFGYPTLGEWVGMK